MSEPKAPSLGETCPNCYHEAHDGQCKHWITHIVGARNNGTSMTRSDRCSCVDGDEVLTIREKAIFGIDGCNLETACAVGYGWIKIENESPEPDTLEVGDLLIWQNPKHSPKVGR